MLGKILTKVIIDLPKTNTPQVSDKPSAWLVVVMKMWKSKMLWADELNRAEISARVLKKKKKSLWSDQAAFHLQQCGLPKRQLKLAGGRPFNWLTHSNVQNFRNVSQRRRSLRTVAEPRRWGAVYKEAEGPLMSRKVELQSVCLL